MKILKSLLAVSLMLSAGAQAASYKTGTLEIDRIVVRDTGTVSVHVYNETFETMGCTLSDRFVIDMNRPGGKAMMQMLLVSAIGPGPQVKLDGCLAEGDGTNTSPKAVSLIFDAGRP